MIVWFSLSFSDSRTLELGHHLPALGKGLTANRRGFDTATTLKPAERKVCSVASGSYSCKIAQL